MLATGTGNSTPLPTTKQNEKITLFYAVFDPISQFYNHAQSYVRAVRVFCYWSKPLFTSFCNLIVGLIVYPFLLISCQSVYLFHPIYHISKACNPL